MDVERCTTSGGSAHIRKLSISHSIMMFTAAKASLTFWITFRNCHTFNLSPKLLWLMLYQLVLFVLKSDFKMDGFSAVGLPVEILCWPSRRNTFTFSRKFGRQSCHLHQSRQLGWVWAINDESKCKMGIQKYFFYILKKMRLKAD